MPRVLGLDTVRAFAALSVMLAHIFAPALPAFLQSLGINQEFSEIAKHIFAGQMVIVFFVVSGFCIHYPYIDKPLPTFAFLAGRWTRIMIPAFVALLLAYILGIKKFNFVDGFILWSIVCELWYYTLYPLFLRFSKIIPFSNQYVLSLIISLSILLYSGSDKHGNVNIYGPWLNWLVALPCWLLGCLLAEQVKKNGNGASSSYLIAWWRVVVIIVAAFMGWLTLNTPIGFYLTMNPFAVLAFFWIRAEIRSAKYENSIFEAIGKWSYSIYLFHVIFFVLISKVIHISPLILVVPVLALCYLAYLTIELPSHNASRRLFKSLSSKL
jgi:peptidoglycan/LPS O-acetylase OafA/YrhL